MKNDKLWKISDNTSNLSTARNRRPQQAGMHFSLRPAKDVLRDSIRKWDTGNGA